MSDSLKISGKNLSLPPQSKQGWKFTVRPGGWIIAESEGGVRRKFMVHEYRGHLSASLRGHLFTGEWLQNQRKVTGSGHVGDLTAQFPGKVRKVLVQKGGVVQEGDSLLLVEAMKMEFAISPFSGRIKEVFIKEGQQLSPGDRFVDLEAIEGGK